MKLYNQRQEFNGEHFKVGDLIEKSKEYPVEEVDIRFLDKWYSLGLKHEYTNLMDVAKAFKRVNKSELKYPVIISNQGAVLDGKHRICKALILGRKKIKVVVIPEDDMPPAIKE